MRRPYARWEALGCQDGEPSLALARNEARLDGQDQEPKLANKARR